MMINQHQQCIPILLAFAIGLQLGYALNHRGLNKRRIIIIFTSVIIITTFATNDDIVYSVVEGHGNATKLSLSTLDLQPLVRDVHVGTMCRCPSNSMPIPGISTTDGIDTNIHQPPSLATGNQYNHYIMHPPTIENGGCTCIQDSIYAETSTDEYLVRISENFYNKRCPASKQAHVSKYKWNTMPDFGVEESLPVFLGVLSYESPLSLNGTVSVLYSEWFYIVYTFLLTSYAHFSF